MRGDSSGVQGGLSDCAVRFKAGGTHCYADELDGREWADRGEEELDRVEPKIHRPVPMQLGEHVIRAHIRRAGPPIRNLRRWSGFAGMAGR